MLILTMSLVSLLILITDTTAQDDLVGEDLGGGGKDDQNSPGGIAVETLLNIRTVASLNLEKRRYEEYTKAVDAEEEGNGLLVTISKGSTAGLSMLIQQWVNALQFFFG